MEKLKEIRNELLSLHKTLLNIERANYEVKYGQVTNIQLFNLLFEHEKFIWLREISILVSEVDELFAAKEGVDVERAKDLFSRTMVLFDEGDQYQDFKKKYQANLDTETRVALHHLKIHELLDKKTA